jgi:hypothetical protein
VGRVTKGAAEDLLEGVSRGEAASPDTSRRSPRAVPWDWIDIGPDNQTLRIEFVHGVVDGLHHVDVDEDDDEVRVTVYLGLNHDLRGGAYVAVGLTAWTAAVTARPIGRRHVTDGAPP